MEQLEGAVAFVTGGASGIGLGMVQAFLQAGMRVVAADVSQRHLDAARELVGVGPCVRYLALDVTDRAAFARAAVEIEEELGPVQLLCNNAGVGMLGDIRKVTYDDWDWCLAVNLGGVINGVQTFLPRMLRHGRGGHIVNTSSIGALMPGPSGTPYLTAKGAIIAMSGCLRIELAASGIGVTALVPGPTATNIHEVAQHRPDRFRNSGLEDVEAVLSQGPLFNDVLDPLQVAAMVLDAVRRDRPFVFTHGEFRQGVEAYLGSILDAFPASSPARIAAMEIQFERAQSRMKGVL